MKIKNALIVIGSIFVSIIFYVIFTKINETRSSIIGYPSFNNFNAVPDMAKYFTLTLVLPTTYLLLFSIINYKKLYANINVHHKKLSGYSENYSDLLLSLFCSLPSIYFIGQNLILKLTATVIFATISYLVFRSKKVALKYLSILFISISNVCLTLNKFWNISFWKFTDIAKTDIIAIYVLGVIISVVILILMNKRYLVNHKLFLRHTFALSSVLVIFNLFYSIPGPIEEIDVFHEGEWLAPAYFLLNGLTPYVDFQPIHGILKDGILQLIGFKLFGTTIYSARLIDALLSKSLMLIGYYTLGLTIFKRHRISFSLIFLVLINLKFFNQIFYSDFRYAPIPFFLILLVFADKNQASKRLAILLPFASIITIFLSPEMFFLVIGGNLYIIVKNIYAFQNKQNPILNYLIISNLIVVLFVIISPIGLGIFKMIQEFSSNLWQVSSIPIDLSRIGWTGTGILFLALVLPFINYLIIIKEVNKFSFFSQNIGITLLISLSTSLGLSKFFTRADTHIYEVVPILLALILITFGKLDEVQIRNKFYAMANKEIQFMFGFIVLIFVIGNNNYQQRSPFEDKTPLLLEKVGPIVSGFEKDKVYLDMVKLKKNLDEIDPKKYVFDFSNAPLATFFYAERLPVSEFFTMTSAARPTTQQAIISDLSRNPSIVIWDGPGFRDWDSITNNIRNYEVASYLIDNYASQISDPDSYTLWRPEDQLVKNNKMGVQISEYQCDFFQTGSNFVSNSKDAPVKLKSEILDKQLYLKLNVDNKILGKNNLINVLSDSKILATTRIADSRAELKIPFLENREISSLQIEINNNLNETESYTFAIDPRLKIGTKIQLAKDISITYEIMNIENTIRFSDFTNIGKLKIKNNNVRLDNRKIINISGWAIDSNGEPFQKIFIIDENKTILSEYIPDINRPDLSGFSPSLNDNYGFNIKLYENKSKSIKRIYIVDKNYNSIPMPKNYENKIKDFGYLIGEKSRSSLGWLENVGVNMQSNYLYLDRGDLNQTISFSILDDGTDLDLPINACEQNFRGRSYYGYLRASEKDSVFSVGKIELLGS